MMNVVHPDNERSEISACTIIEGGHVLVSMQTVLSFYSQSLELIRHVRIREVFDGLMLISQFKQLEFSKSDNFLMAARISGFSKEAMSIKHKHPAEAKAGELNLVVATMELLIDEEPSNEV